MKHRGLLLIVIIAVSAVILPVAYLSSLNQSAKSKDEFYFGVTYGQDIDESYQHAFICDTRIIP